MTGETERCDNCRFSLYAKPDEKQNLPEAHVICRFFPPTVLPDGTFRYARNPSHGWCGQWQSAVTPEVISETKEWADDG